MFTCAESYFMRRCKASYGLARYFVGPSGSGSELFSIYFTIVHFRLIPFMPKLTLEIAYPCTPQKPWRRVDIPILLFSNISKVDFNARLKLRRRRSLSTREKLCSIMFLRFSTTLPRGIPKGEADLLKKEIARTMSDFKTMGVLCISIDTILLTE